MAGNKLKVLCLCLVFPLLLITTGCNNVDRHIQYSKVSYPETDLDSLLDKYEISHETYTDQVVKITGYDGTAKKIDIPEKIDGASVVLLGNNAFNNTEVEELTISGSIHKIESNTFSSLSHLKKVTFREGVTEIATDAFVNCPSLNEVVLPKSLTKMLPASIKNAEDVILVVQEGTYAHWFAIVNGMNYQFSNGKTADIEPKTAAAWTAYDFLRNFPENYYVCNILTTSEKDVTDGEYQGNKCLDVPMTFTVPTYDSTGISGFETKTVTLHISTDGVTFLGTDDSITNAAEWDK